MSKLSLPDHRAAYLALIDDTLSYIQALRPPLVPTTKPRKKTPTRALPLRSPQPKPTPVPPASATPKPTPTPQPQPKPTPKLATQEPIQPSFTLTPPLPPAAASLQATKTLITQLFPNLPLKSEPPSDEQAKKIKTSWQTKQNISEVALLIQTGQFTSFFSALSQAISLCLAPAKTFCIEPLERENKWEVFLTAKQLRLILIPDAALFASKNLLPYTRELPQKNARFLKDVPLLLLPDPSLYLKDPLLKRSLWTLIQKALR